MKRKLMTIILVLCMLLCLCACGETGSAVNVQRADQLAALAQAGNRYAAMVVSEDVTNINRDSSKSILGLYVAVGDAVKAGDKLFTYDSEALELELEKQQLELEKMKNEQVSYAEQLVKLEQQLANTWNETEKSRITLEINTLKTTQLENDYAIISKENSIADIQQVLANIDVFSPVDGTIRQINEDDPSQSYITIQQEGAYRIKGSLNEMNMGSLFPGMRIRAVSRIDSDVAWLGTIASIDTEAPSQNEDPWYGGYSDGMTTSSSYVFFADLDSTEGLLLGQHVYVELLPTELVGLWIPESFLFDISMDEETFEMIAKVWVMGSSGKLESRSVTLGMYDASGCYEILSGIVGEDYLADPADPGCAEGAAVSKREASDFSGGEG